MALIIRSRLAGRAAAHLPRTSVLPGRTACAVALLAVGLFASASVQQIPFEHLVEMAEIIAVGQVSDMTSHFTGDEQRIYTLVTIEVEETLKGSTGDRYVVRIGGGQVGDTRMGEFDEPVMAVGETAIFFLQQQGSHHSVAGRAQGKLAIHQGRVFHNGVDKGSLTDVRARILRELGARGS